MSLAEDFVKSLHHSLYSTFLFLCILTVSQDLRSQELMQYHACLPIATLPAMMAIDSPSETVSKPLIKCFYLSCLSHGVSSQHSTVTKTSRHQALGCHFDNPDDAACLDSG